MAPSGKKIATCCYCGRRTALVLTGDKLHELACASCGAPLRDLKALPKKTKQKKSKQPRTVADAVPEDAWLSHAPRRKKRKRRKPVSRRIASELFDLIEDIFD